MTNHADLIAALRIPMIVTIRKWAPELDEYDEQRKAAADELEAAWAEATAAAYGAAVDVCKKHKITSEEIPLIGEYTDDVDNIISALTPQSARDWLAAHDAEVYRRGQEDMRERAADVLRDKWASTSAEHEAAIRALPIKEKYDE